MNSYCISIESKKYVKKIKRRIRAIKSSNGKKYVKKIKRRIRAIKSSNDTLLSCKIEEHEVEETTKILAKRNAIDGTYDHEKSDLSEDDKSISNESQNEALSKVDATYNHKKSDSPQDKSICNESQNETLPLNCKFNLNFSLADPYDPDNTKLDSLTCGQASIGKKVKGIFPKSHKIFAYSQYFRSSPTLDALRKKLNICSLTGEHVKYQNYFRKKYVDSICKFSNTFSRPKLVNVEALKLKKCSVKLQRITLPENYSFKFDSCYDFKSFQNVSQLKSIINSMSVNQDDSVQKLPQGESSLKKTLQETNTPAAIRKGLRPRCPNSGLAVLKDCSCNKCAAQKLAPALCNKKNKSKKISNTVVPKKGKSCQTKKVLPLKNSVAGSVDFDAVNSSTRTSKRLSKAKSIRPKVLNSVISTVKPNSGCAVRTDRYVMTYSEEKLQKNLNITVAETTVVSRKGKSCQTKNVSPLKNSVTGSVDLDAMNSSTRTSKIFSTEKSIRPRSLNSDITTFKPSTACAVQTDECTISCSEDIFQINANEPELETTNTGPRKVICTPKRKTQLKPRKISGTYLTESLSSDDEDTNPVRRSENRISYRKNKHKISSCNEPRINDIIRSKDTSTQTGNKRPMVETSNTSPSKKLYTSYIVKKSLPKEIFPSSSASKEASFLPKKNVSESEEYDVENFDHGDIDHIHKTFSYNEVSKKVSTEKSNDKDYRPKVRISVTSSYSLRSEEHNSNSRQSDDEDFDPAKIDCIHKTSSHNKISKKLSPDKSDEDYRPRVRTSVASFYSPGSKKHNSNSRISDDEDFDHDDINPIHKTSRNEISKKLSTDKSDDKDYCPKKFRIFVDSSYSLRSKRPSNSRHAKVKDCSGGSCPVPKSKSRISYRKDQYF